MPNYCFNGINIKYVDEYENTENEDILDDINFHLRNQIFDEDNKIWDKIKDSPYSRAKDGKSYRIYTETMSDREHALLVKYELDDNDEINFNNIIEEPDLIYDPDGYWWRVRNWGTKWDGFLNEYIDKTSNQLYIAGDTAWSPCEPIVERISKLYPEVHIKHTYDEPGMAFCGVVEYENGNKISEIMENDFCDYRHAAKELELATDILYKCGNCENLFYDFEVEDDDNFECECGSHIFIHDLGYCVLTRDDGPLLYGNDINNIDKTRDEYFK